MKIEQLTIENFKCFKSEKTFDFARLTILTGANSSGKSSIMYAILAALQTDDFPYQLSPNGNYINLGDFREIVYEHNENLNFHLGITLNSLRGKLDLNTQWKKDEVDLLPTIFKVNIVKRNSKATTEYQGFDYNNLDIQIQLRQPFESKNIDEDCRGLEQIFRQYYGQEKCRFVPLDNSNMLISNFDILKYSKNWVNAPIKGNELLLENPLTQDVVDSLNPRFDFELNFFYTEQMNYVGAFRESPKRTYLEKNKNDFKVGTEGEGYIDQIVEWEKRSNGKIKELIKVMKSLDLIEDIKTRRLSSGIFEVLVKPTKSKMLTSLSNVGFGVSQFLPVIVADLQLRDDSTLFLAEPEIHLHPSIQSKFGDYIVDKINTTEKNYVIETHSEYFLNRIRLAIVKGELKKEDVKVYFLENNGTDTDVFDIEFTKTGVINNAPRNFFDTYFADSMAITLNAFAE